MQIFQMDKKHITDIKFPAFIVKADNETGEWILKEGIPEIKLINSCIKYLAKDKAFIDIGAHMGTYSIILSKYCKYVYAFEAQSSTYYQLCGAIALNNINNISANHYGIQDVDDEKELYVTTPDGGGSSFIQPNSYLYSEWVPMKKIDDICILPKVGLIKLDIEGYELKALQGAVKLIEKDRPVILFESNQDDFLRESIKKLLNRLGYNVEQTTQQPNMFIATYNK
jgi:FkbM family methyltransferase